MPARLCHSGGDFSCNARVIRSLVVFNVPMLPGCWHGCITGIGRAVLTRMDPVRWVLHTCALANAPANAMLFGMMVLTMNYEQSTMHQHPKHGAQSKIQNLQYVRTLNAVPGHYSYSLYAPKLAKWSSPRVAGMGSKGRCNLSVICSHSAVRV